MSSDGYDTPMSPPWLRKETTAGARADGRRRRRDTERGGMPALTPQPPQIAHHEQPHGDVPASPAAAQAPQRQAPQHRRYEEQPAAARQASAPPPAAPPAAPYQPGTAPMQPPRAPQNESFPQPPPRQFTPPVPPAPPMPAPRPQPQRPDQIDMRRRARRAPQHGWRRAVHRVSGGSISPGPSSDELAYRELVDRVNQPIRGDYRVAVLSLKGGVGKTTTTVGLGSTFASLRGDRVIAVDANPDLGTLAQRVPRQTDATVRDMLQDPSITRYSDVRAYTSQSRSRMEVLASEQDPSVSEAFSEHDYRSAVKILQQFYNIILTDCGTGLMHSAMNGVLGVASSLVLVSSPAIDGARSASATLDWLGHHGFSHLVDRTVVVISATRSGASNIDLDELRRMFLDRCRAVQFVPYDDHLAEGAEIDLDLVGKRTRRAYVELAAMVADDFPAAPGRHTAGADRR